MPALMPVRSQRPTVLLIRKEVAMDQSRLPEGPSAEELAERLGELLSDDEMQNVIGGNLFEFSFPETLV